LSRIFRQKKRIRETGDRIQGPRPSATGGAGLIGVAWEGRANVVLKPLRGNRSNRCLDYARHDRGRGDYVGRRCPPGTGPGAPGLGVGDCHVALLLAMTKWGGIRIWMLLVGRFRVCKQVAHPTGLVRNYYFLIQRKKTEEH